MRICAISDTHNQHFNNYFNNLPDADVLVHAGDLTIKGTPGEIHSVSDWFKELATKYKHVVFIAGNHDILFEKHPKVAESYFKIPNVYYLKESEVVIDGIKFYGAPQTLWFHDWAFNVQPHIIHEHWEDIPSDTDVLITHGPPFGYLDFHRNQHLGCSALMDRIKWLNLKAHIFGHIHRDNNEQPIKFGNTLMVNASILDNNYSLKNSPIVIDI